jgi:SAM-dependent methyltransferase
MNAWRTFRFSLTKKWSLIRRHVPGGGAILDAGCGFGDWVSFLSAHGYRAEGLDFSRDLVRRLQETYPHLTWTHGDIRRMPYPDGAFDAIISWGVIEHDEAGPVDALCEFRRLLAPGGVAIVTVPNDSPANRRAAEYHYPRTLPGHSFFQYFMTETDLSTYARDAGFDVLDSGVLPSASVHLLSPALAARLSGFAFRLADSGVEACLSWLPQLCVMRYCVAMRPRA